MVKRWQCSLIIPQIHEKQLNPLSSVVPSGHYKSVEIPHFLRRGPCGFHRQSISSPHLPCAGHGTARADFCTALGAAKRHGNHNTFSKESSWQLLGTRMLSSCALRPSRSAIMLPFRSIRMIEEKMLQNSKGPII